MCFQAYVRRRCVFNAPSVIKWRSEKNPQKIVCFYRGVCYSRGCAIIRVIRYARCVPRVARMLYWAREQEAEWLDGLHDTSNQQSGWYTQDNYHTSKYWLNCTQTCSDAVLVLWIFFSCGGRRGGEYVCPTRLVVDATQTSKEGGVTADVCRHLPDCFKILHSSWRHWCTYTYVLRTYSTLVPYHISSPK